MNHHATFFGIKTTLLFCVAFAAVLPVMAAPAAPTPPLPRSVFILPTNPREGCDPFFPTSTRPYASAVAAAPATVSNDLSALVMQGISGPPDHRLAIINNVTFAAGDEAEVRTAQGRIRIHCLRVTDKSALIEAGGQRQELRYEEKP
jgi:hypothetical protein